MYHAISLMTTYTANSKAIWRRQLHYVIRSHTFQLKLYVFHALSAIAAKTALLFCCCFQSFFWACCQTQDFCPMSWIVWGSNFFICVLPWLLSKSNYFCVKTLLRKSMKPKRNSKKWSKNGPLKVVKEYLNFGFLVFLTQGGLVIKTESMCFTLTIFKVRVEE